MYIVVYKEEHSILNYNVQPKLHFAVVDVSVVASSLRLWRDLHFDFSQRVEAAVAQVVPDDAVRQRPRARVIPPYSAAHETSSIDGCKVTLCTRYKSRIYLANENWSLKA